LSWDNNGIYWFDIFVTSRALWIHGRYHRFDTHYLRQRARILHGGGGDGVEVLTAADFGIQDEPGNQAEMDAVDEEIASLVGMDEAKLFMDQVSGGAMRCTAWRPANTRTRHRRVPSKRAASPCLGCS